LASGAADFIPSAAQSRIFCIDEVSEGVDQSFSDSADGWLEGFAPWQNASARGAHFGLIVRA
jgi:hypothetical protein